MVRAAIIESGGQFGWHEIEQESAPLHAVAGKACSFSQHCDGARKHARSAVIAGIAFDQHRAAAHVVADTVAGIARDDHHASRHAVPDPGNSGGKEIVRIAANVEQTVFHPACSISANIAMYSNSAVFHGKPKIGAGIAVYRDTAAGHRLPDAVEFVATVFNHQPG